LIVNSFGVGIIFSVVNVLFSVHEKRKIHAKIISDKFFIKNLFCKANKILIKLKSNHKLLYFCASKKTKYEL